MQQQLLGLSIAIMRELRYLWFKSRIEYAAEEETRLSPLFSLTLNSLVFCTQTHWLKFKIGTTSPANTLWATVKLKASLL